MVNKQRAYGVFATIFTVLAINFWLGAFIANASTVSQISSSDTTRQMHSNATFREDKRLTNSCIETGESKSYCVCLTTVYKHRLDLRTYIAAVSLFEAERSTDTNAYDLARTELEAQNYTPAEIDEIDAARKTLLEASGFKQRCDEAVEYFTAGN